MNQLLDNTSDIKVLVISLKESLDRRALVEQNMASLQLPWRFMDACSHQSESKITVDYDEQLKRFGRQLTPGEIGVFKSHMLALAEFDHDPSFNWLIVLEDDVWIDTDFDYKGLANFLESLDIGYLRLFCRQWMKAKHFRWFNERQILRLSTDPYGMQGYIISRQEAIKFRNSVKLIVRPIDDEIGRFWENGLKIFMIFPFPISERAIPSTLLSDRVALKQDAKRNSISRIAFKIKDYVMKRIFVIFASS